MVPSIVKIVVATIVYAAVHSLLASRAAKRFATSVVGEHNYRAFYRPFYVAQATVTTGALFLYMAGSNTPTLYRVRGLPALCVRSGQVLALCHLYAGLREVGLLRITGVDSMLLRMHGAAVPDAPVAQGPEADIATGTLAAGGPFRWSRHPLNLSAVPLVWLTPKLTTGRLAFNLLATLYLVLGSWHEELRLHAAYGRKYSAYVRSGVPFFLPLPASGGRRQPHRVVSR